MKNKKIESGKHWLIIFNTCFVSMILGIGMVFAGVAFTKRSVWFVLCYSYIFIAVFAAQYYILCIFYLKNTK